VNDLAKPTPTNLLGVVEHPAFSPFVPYQIDADGRPYVPVGNGGVVLGVRLGDSVFAHDADHVAPGVTLGHDDPAARYALTAFACVGNRAEVRGGPAAGAAGRVIGKRGEDGRALVAFPQRVLERLRPGDQVLVRGHGQGANLAGHAEVTVYNLDPALLGGALPVDASTAGPLRVGVRAVLPSRLCGNGIGRPAQLWDVDLQVTPETAFRYDLAGLRLGDLVAISDLDARHNLGYRAGYLTVGVVVHGGSPLPGHGPGVTPLLTGPAGAFTVDSDERSHRGLTEAILGIDDAPERQPSRAVDRVKE
jgi:Domain of unknown function (DUF4438)